MYHFNLVPKMGLAENLSLYHRDPNLVQIRKSEMHHAFMNFKISKNYIKVKDVRIF